MNLRGAHLELIVATPETVRAEMHDLAELARLLQARVPSNWPPPLNDVGSQQWTLQYLLAHPDARGFSTWYLALPASDGSERSLIGIAGFKGKPTSDGTVEVGYSVMEDQQRRGYGTEAAGVLIAWAFGHPEVRRVVAETYPHLRPSIRVMERNGMVFLGRGAEEGVVRFGITREAFEAAKRP